jgi:hypothetical protein
MAKAAAAAWAACLKDLQQQVAAASASKPAPGRIISHASTEFRSSMQCIRKLKDQPPLPHAAWKKLAQDVQVMCWRTPCAGVPTHMTYAVLETYLQLGKTIHQQMQSCDCCVHQAVRKNTHVTSMQPNFCRTGMNLAP